jgi:hypothetical protein
VEVELIELADGRSSPGHEVFSLLFRGPGKPLLAQRLYPFEHDAIGMFDLFIVPVGRDERGIYYEAVFNRLVKAGEG